MPKTILLVEDSDDDFFFAMRAFRSGAISSPLVRVEDGRKAIDYLSGRGEFGDRSRFPVPALVLLDIKMPFVTGFEVLHWIRSSSNCPRIPVVIFTSSNQECDIEQAYALGANAYLVKPSRADSFSDLASLIRRFWVEANLAPGQHTGDGESPMGVPTKY